MTIDIGGQLAAVVGSPAVQLPGVWLLLRSDRALGSAAAVHPGGMVWGLLVGFSGVYCSVRCRGFRSGCSAWNRSHASHGSGRRFQPIAAAVAAGDRCGADNAGNLRLSDVATCAVNVRYRTDGKEDP